MHESSTSESPDVAVAELKAASDGESSEARTALACSHCGLPCRDSAPSLGDKSFCCLGCRTVFELLTENGLGDFYNMGETAGVRVKSQATADQFKFLDELAVRERLVDFTNERLTRLTLHIPAIHCIACVWLLENLFRLKPGIGQSQVNFPRKEVSITFETEKLKLGELVVLLASLGYEPELKFSDLQTARVSKTPRRLWLQLGIAGFAFGNIMLFSLSSYLGLDSSTGPAFRKMMGWFSLALATPVFFYSAADYWRAAWVSLRQRLLTIDVPIAVGIVALYGQSAFEVLSGRGEGYFDSLAGLIFFLLCGKLFQQKTYDRLSFERDYQSFFPLSVTRRLERRSPTRRGDELYRAGSKTGAPSEERVSLSQLAVGDRLILRNGELIPADGRLVVGPALIDYSFVTGESEPVAKQPGDYLYAGGRQIGGAIEVEMAKAVSQSYLTSLWNQDAFKKDKAASLDNLTNRYSQRFTKLVLAVALGAAGYWAFFDPSIAVKTFTSVLIVACPCALALAAPFALGTAVRLLGRRNVFLKNAHVVETLARVDAVVFDKTGTLTAAGAGSVSWEGAAPNEVSLAPGFSRVSDRSVSRTVSTVSDQRRKTDKSASTSVPANTGLKPGADENSHHARVGDLSEAEERWLYSMTRHSTHPLAVRVGDAIAHEHFPETVRSFLETAGCGMEGSVAGNEIWMGSQGWLEQRGVERLKSSRVAKAALSTLQPFNSSTLPTGPTIHVAINGKYRGCFLLASALRPEADKLIHQLSQNYELALLSGDNAKERSRFTELFGVDAKLRFNQSPLNKLGFIRELQERGRTVMMVGDGLNDAGALQQSDVGVAVVENVSAFSPASDVIAASSTIPRLSDVLSFARDSVHVVRTAFVVSAAYNVIGVTIAAQGLLSPVVCAILMPLSSVTVVAFACGATTWAARRGNQDKTFAKDVESGSASMNYERASA